MNKFNSRLSATVVAGLSVFLSFNCSKTTLAGDLTGPKAKGLEKMLDPTALDRQIDPCTDFYAFACGGWMNNVQLRPDRAQEVRSFSSIDDNNQAVLKDILDNFAGNAKIAGSTVLTPQAKKLGDFYASCMDEDAINKAGADLLAKQLAEVDAVKSPQDLAAELAALHTKGVDALFGMYADQDAKDATLNVAILVPGGMGLPQKDYYLSNDGKFPAIREKYHAFIQNALKLADIDAANEAMIYKIESDLADKRLQPEDARDPEKTYNSMTLAQLEKLAPGFEWGSYFKALGITQLDKIDVTEPVFYTQVGALAAGHTVEEMKTYLKWELIRAFAGFFGKDLKAASFDFNGRVLAGLQDPPPRWETCLAATEGAMGELLGDLFAQKTFGEDGKQKSDQIIQDIRAAFGANLAQLDWLDDATRAKANDKLQAVTRKIGFPDEPEQYAGVEVNRSTYFENVMSGNTFSSKKTFAKVGNTVDRKQWGMLAEQVNAYYNPAMNEIVFPAGILQSPFFDREAPMSANYGAIGVVMGHELTHGFDDQGRLYDPVGNLNNWWSPSVGEKFEAKADCLVKQYSNYTVAGGVHLKGALTLGENIADYGGVKFAYAAYQEAKKRNPPAQNLIGLDDNQQFFVGFAQSWCSVARPEEEQRRAATDPHSPPKYRVNGVLVNTPAFAEAFNCKAGAAMAPVERCSLW